MRIASAATLAVALFLNGAVALAQQDVVEVTPGVDAATEVPRAVEQVEIMRVVLTKALNRALGAETSTRSAWTQPRGELDDDFFQSLDEGRADPALLAQSVRARTVTSHTRGFYAPGLAAWFDTEIETPVVASRSDEGEAAGDAWESAAAEVRGEGRSRSISSDAALARARDALGVEWGLDEAAIERAVAAAIETIAAYGHRLDGLRRGEDVVVALRFVPNAALAPSVPVLSQVPTLGFYFGRQGRAAQVKPKTVVIRVAKSDLPPSGVDGAAVAVRDRARVTRY